MILQALSKGTNTIGSWLEITLSKICPLNNTCLQERKKNNSSRALY